VNPPERPSLWLLRSRRFSADAGRRLQLPESNVVGIRPEHLRVCAPGKLWPAARVERVENPGECALLHMRIRTGAALSVRTGQPPTGGRNAEILLRGRADDVHRCDRESGRRV